MVTRDTAVAEMTAFYNDYIESFNRQDIEGSSRFFAFPWVIDSAAHGSHVLRDAAAHIQMFTQASAQVRAQGWARSGVDQLKAFPTGHDTGLLVSDFTRYRADGSVLESRRGHYTVQRGATGWKILSIVEGPRT